MGKVLIVDDCANMREIVEEICKRVGVEYESEDCGECGLAKYKDYDPDLVIIDKQMPRGDGIWLTKEIKKIDKDAKLVLYSSWMGFVDSSLYVACVDKDRLRHLENVIRDFFRLA